MSSEQRPRPRWENDPLFADLMAIMFRCDPVGISFEDNTDEYSPEVERLLPFLPAVGSETELLEVVLEVFRDMFDQLYGTLAVYAAMPHELWNRWQQARASQTT